MELKHKVIIGFLIISVILAITYTFITVIYFKGSYEEEPKRLFIRYTRLNENIPKTIDQVKPIDGTRTHVHFRGYITYDIGPGMNTLYREPNLQSVKGNITDKLILCFDNADVEIIFREYEMRFYIKATFHDLSLYYEPNGLECTSPFGYYYHPILSPGQYDCYLNSGKYYPRMTFNIERLE